jgi:DNA-binding GntR family transcriptional regulator
VRLLEHINARIFFVRQINIEDEGRRQATFAEHRDIVAELLAGHTDAATDILRRHLKLSAEEAMEAVRRGLERIYAKSIA